jgi:hypothetical protein
MTIAEFFRKYWTWLSLGIVLGIVGVIAVGIFTMPGLFYDQWIWIYYWGSVVADVACFFVFKIGIPDKEG